MKPKLKELLLLFGQRPEKVAELEKEFDLDLYGELLLFLFKDFKFQHHQAEYTISFTIDVRFDVYDYPFKRSTCRSYIHLNYEDSGIGDGQQKVFDSKVHWALSLEDSAIDALSFIKEKVETTSTIYITSSLKGKSITHFFPWVDPKEVKDRIDQKVNFHKSWASEKENYTIDLVQVFGPTQLYASGRKCLIEDFTEYFQKKVFARKKFLGIF